MAASICPRRISGHSNLPRHRRIEWRSRSRRTLATTSALPADADAQLDDLAATPFADGPTLPSGSLTSYDPLAHSRERRHQLPPSRYQYRSPRYYRGPLHPHQPPPPSDPASREFVPGPFTCPRLEQTYQSTIASDIMTLAYQHHPPGFKPPPKAPRLRSWEGSSPYFKNRPLRAPRGTEVLGLLPRRITFRNVPKLEGIVVHTFVRDALEKIEALQVATMALQAITGVRVQGHRAKHSVVNWGVRAGKWCAATAELKGEDMYHFLGKLVDVVMPRIREWKGIKGSSGDDNGNIGFGFTRDVVALFPEIEVNYDAYPPKLVPGIHITIQTSATTDKEARLLLTALGIPITGKVVN